MHYLSMSLATPTSLHPPISLLYSSTSLTRYQASSRAQVGEALIDGCALYLNIGKELSLSFSRNGRYCMSCRSFNGPFTGTIEHVFGQSISLGGRTSENPLTSPPDPSTLPTGFRLPVHNLRGHFRLWHTLHRPCWFSIPKSVLSHSPYNSRLGSDRSLPTVSVKILLLLLITMRNTNYLHISFMSQSLMNDVTHNLQVLGPEKVFHISRIGQNVEIGLEYKPVQNSCKSCISLTCPHMCEYQKGTFQNIDTTCWYLSNCTHIQ